MKTLNIVVCCNGGMSSSLFCSRLIGQAKLHGFECVSDAYGVGQINTETAGSADVLLLAPQVRFYADELAKKIPGVPIEPISMQDYGMVNGAAVFDKLLAKFAW